MAIRWYHNPIHELFHVPTTIRRLYLLSAVRTIIVSLGGVFLPLLFFKELGIGGPVLYALAYIAGVGITDAFLLKRGESWLERDISLGIFISSIGLVLGTILNGFLVVFLSGFILGIGSGFYWFVHHVSYVLFGKKKDEQREYSLELILLNLVSLLTPFIVGVLTLFIKPAHALLLLSLLLFGVVVGLPKEVGRTLISFRKFVSADIQIFSPYTLLFFIEGLFTIGLFFLPVYLYSTGLSFSATAFVVSAVVLLRIFLDYLVGHVPERASKPIAVLTLLVVSLILLAIYLAPPLAPILYIFLPTELFYLIYTAWIYERSRNEPEVLIDRETLALPLGKILMTVAVFLLGIAMVPLITSIAGLLLALGYGKIK